MAFFNTFYDLVVYINKNDSNDHGLRKYDGNDSSEWFHTVDCWKGSRSVAEKFSQMFLSWKWEARRAKWQEQMGRLRFLRVLRAHKEWPNILKYVH